MKIRLKLSNFLDNFNLLVEKTKKLDPKIAERLIYHYKRKNKTMLILIVLDLFLEYTFIIFDDYTVKESKYLEKEIINDPDNVESIIKEKLKSNKGFKI